MVVLNVVVGSYCCKRVGMVETKDGWMIRGVKMVTFRKEAK
jgi:hypothetical protein